VRRLLLLLVAAGCGGSAPPLVHFTASWPERPPEYQAAYDRWTRHERVWREMIQAVDGYATLESPDFRAAFVTQRAKEGRMSEAAAAQAIADEQVAIKNGWQIELVIQTGDPTWNDFGRSGKSMWRIALVADGVESLPVSVVEDPRPAAQLRIWFPGLSSFHHAYILTFPPGAIAADAHKVSLLLSSAPTQVQFDWAD
jgi:hypothetical protein